MDLALTWAGDPSVTSALLRSAQRPTKTVLARGNSCFNIQSTIFGRRSMTPARTKLVKAGLALSLAGTLLLPTSALAADTTTDPVKAAAGYLAAQLKDGERMVTVFDGVEYPDYGLTTDVVLALDAAKVGQTAAAKATAFLSKPENVTEYVGDGKTSSYAGAHAKLALTLQAQGKNPASVGNRDLLTELIARRNDKGRFVDLGEDYSNTFTQSFGVMALHRAGKSGNEVVFLAGNQCKDGGFPLKLESGDGCESHVDSTGLAVQALLTAGKKDVAGKALNWLVSQQNANGGFTGGPAAPAINTNSTGLALGALRAGGRNAQADKAAALLTSWQQGCSAPAGQRGGIAYSAAGFDTANAARATAQGVPGLAGVNLATVSKDGASAGTPALDCAATPPSSAPETPVAPKPETIAAPPAKPSVPLADTGVHVGYLAMLGGLLLVGGAGAFWLARKPGSSS
ncbi:peptidase [Pseudonocardiaceae bacterium YIM PH 21723]|nr:peptidase [Pseudonocardiaceae bacterium YIM PH 21723]